MHILIVTGGSLDFSFANQYIKTLSFDKVFAVDKGLEYVYQLGLKPDYILGDFDTVKSDILSEYMNLIEHKELDAIVMRHPPMKDASDSELALQEAINIGATKITVLAGTGTRLDHVLANLNILQLAEDKNIECYIVDANNRIQLLSDTGRKKHIIHREEQFGKYVSIILMSNEIEGLTMEGFVYPVKDMRLQQGSSLTVSNELSEEKGIISIAKGKIWVIESHD